MKIKIEIPNCLSLNLIITKKKKNLRCQFNFLFIFKGILIVSLCFSIFNQISNYHSVDLIITKKYIYYENIKKSLEVILKFWHFDHYTFKMKKTLFILN
jgi:hypothetical protein